MKASLRVIAVAAAALLFAAVLGAAGFYVAREYYAADLPSVASLHEIKLGVPLRVYTHDAKLIGEFGAERRDPLRFDQIPKPLTQAFLAAEDDRFFEHSGVDMNGLLRAGVVLVTTGEKRQGGSTITMQLARNVFLSSERSFARKFKEILLARKIESELSKQQILELYLNRIFLGNRAYGVGAAAQIYFGKDVGELSLSEMATIAGLPKAPSRDNPLNNPKRAHERRDYVLRRMRDLGWISAADYQTAFAEPITAFEHGASVEIEARYVAEMVRAELYAKYGDATYTDGYSVTTTLDSTRQTAATASLRGGLIAYGERHGFGGPEARLPEELIATLGQKADSPQVRAQLEARQPVAGLLPAVVLSYSPDLLRLHTLAGLVELPRPGFQWANLDKKPLRAGDIVRIAKIGSAWRLTEVPDVQGAFVALNPRDGAVQALVGGFDFFLGNFNRVVQARRQVGSGFKPILYTAALSKGYTPASMFLDAPVVFTSSVSPDDDWRPGNYEGKFKGPMRLREALTLSRNLVSVRVGQAVGVSYAREFATRFGIAKDRVPEDLTLALGSAALTPLEQARAYCVFANGGFLVDPYYVETIRNGKGEEIFRAKPKQACPECDAPPPAPVDPQNPAAVTPADAAAPEAAPLVAAENRAPRTLGADLDFLITSMMHDVVTRGTAAQVKAMGRDDLAGKTGTSNDETDAWFNGFAQQQLVGVVWVGYDKPAPLGKGEVGGRAAVPIWMDFMKTALKGLPQLHFAMPGSLVPVMINPANGKLATDGAPGAIPEIVQADHLPPPDDGKSAFGDGETPGSDIY